MKHSITELYTLYNVDTNTKIATREYCEANNIPCYEKTPKTYEERQAGYAKPCVSHVNNNSKGLNVLNVGGKKKIYLFGEKTWFDTPEELEKIPRAVSARASTANLAQFSKKRNYRYS